MSKSSFFDKSKYVFYRFLIFSFLQKLFRGFHTFSKPFITKIYGVFHFNFYIECLEMYKKYGKMFQTKVVGFEEGYIGLILVGAAKVRSKSLSIF